MAVRVCTAGIPTPAQHATLGVGSGRPQAEVALSCSPGGGVHAVEPVPAGFRGLGPLKRSFMEGSQPVMPTGCCPSFPYYTGGRWPPAGCSFRFCSAAHHRQPR